MVEIVKPELMKARCMKIIYRKDDKILICGKISSEHRILESNSIFFRLYLCEEHYDEFEKKEKEEKEKENKRFKKTDFKCPECGEPVFKHYHIRHGLHPEYRWFWCPNRHDLYCGNCEHGTDSHGDICGAFFCLNGSGWKPIKKEE